MATMGRRHAAAIMKECWFNSLKDQKDQEICKRSKRTKRAANFAVETKGKRIRVALVPRSVKCSVPVTTTSKLSLTIVDFVAQKGNYLFFP